MDDDSRRNKPVSCCESLASDLSKVTPDLVGFYLHGSASLGGWNASKSDIDAIIVVEDDISRESLETMVDVLVERVDDCPVRGLECSIVTRSAARSIRDRWPFLAHFNSGGDDISNVFPDSPDRSDPDLLMHYVVCRAAGIAIHGPPPGDAIGPVDRTVVLGYLADEMEWGLAHGGSAYALLNACRALEYLEQERIVSKIDGGLIALHRDDTPHDEIRLAIDAQRGDGPEVPLGPPGEALVRKVARQLRDASICRPRRFREDEHGRG